MPGSFSSMLCRAPLASEILDRFLPPAKKFVLDQNHTDSDAATSSSSTPASSHHCQRQCVGPDNHISFLSEHAFVIMAKSTNWNPFILCKLPCLCRRMNALAKRFLWREFCLSRAPKMVNDLLQGSKNGYIEGGWQPLAKLLLYCAGEQQSEVQGHSYLKRKKRRSSKVHGHFAHRTRFSRTTGRYFLVRQCRGDVLYVTDACEHAVEKEKEREEPDGVGEEDEEDEEEVGLFRGMFKGFCKSGTRRLLTQRRAQLDEKSVCPFCGARGWQMGALCMVPKSAAKRLAAHNDKIDYFLCLNGHINGVCALLPLSDDEDDAESNYGDDHNHV